MTGSPKARQIPANPEMLLLKHSLKYPEWHGLMELMGLAQGVSIMSKMIPILRDK